MDQVWLAHDTTKSTNKHEDGDEDNIDKQGGRGGHDASIGKSAQTPRQD